MQNKDLTAGPITRTLLGFALPMILGNLLQQLYNIADTFIVGQILGASALAAVGSAYSLMTFLTSIILGLCMGSGTVFSIRFGAGDTDGMKNTMFVSFVLIGGFSVLLNAAVFLLIDPIMRALCVPREIYGMMREYLWIIFMGICATFLYNYFASLLRAVGNSGTPLIFLAVSAMLNILLDIWFVAGFRWGVGGAAAATVIAQFVSGIGLLLYLWLRIPWLRVRREHMRFSRAAAGEVLRFSFLTCVQQSVMNFGILMVQGLINSFGTVIMAAFAAAVKIDSFAYMPVQDFGNAFSTFIAQNYGARKGERIQKGIRSAILCAVIFCLVITAGVCIFAKPLMLIFVRPEETAVIAAGVSYLRIEGAFYCGIGCLFLLYGFYRAIGKPGISVVLTVISLGTRVVLAYSLAAVPTVGVTGIWWSVPIGWILADLVGLLYYQKYKRTLRD